MTEQNSSPEIPDGYEVEEVLVYAQFDALLNDELLDSGSTVKVIGLETHEPFIQIGNQMYCGKWKDMTGTALFFEEFESPPPSDPVFSEVPAKMLKYLYKTRKGLELSRVFINPKKKDSTISEDAQDGTVKHTQEGTNLEDIKEETFSLKEEDLTSEHSSR